MLRIGNTRSCLNDDILHSKTNNFLASVYFGQKYVGVSFLDVSTGEFLISQGNEEYIDKLLQNFNPSEVLVSKPKKNEFLRNFWQSISIVFIWKIGCFKMIMPMKLY